MNTNKIRFGLIGSGWRGECYIKIAQMLPKIFQLCGIVVRNPEKRKAIASKWDVNVYDNPFELYEKEKPDFLLSTVSKNSVSDIIIEITSKGIPLLAETPPSTTIDGLIQLGQKISKSAKIQVAEQFHLQPMHKARLSFVDTGRLGNINYSHVSINHGYHGISLMRKMLGITYENAKISGISYKSSVVEGPGRNGFPDEEKISVVDHNICTFDFGNKVGLYDFERNQHRSFIRNPRILVRGSRGEIDTNKIRYLIDYKTPVEIDLKRINAGEDGNLEGYLKKIEPPQLRHA
jgi:predicted dehydrogenase